MDAVSYTAFGGVFTANMTGNTVLLGIAAAHLRGTDAAHSGVALGGFALGALIGTWLRRTRFVFVAEAAALVVAAIFGANGLVYPAIAAAACTMGMQTAALRSRTPDGIKVTYITGTVTTMWAGLAAHDAAKVRPSLPAEVWVAYAIGGVCGALLERAWGPNALLIPAAVTVLVGSTARSYSTSDKPMAESG